MSEGRGLVRASAAMGVATAVAILVGFVRAKYLAVTIGAAGVGVLSLAMQFTALASHGVGLGLPDGILRSSAKAHRSDDFTPLSGALFFSLRRHAVVAVSLIAVIGLAPATSAALILQDASLWAPLLLCAIGVLFSVVVTDASAVLLGQGLVARAAILKIFLALSSLLTVVWLVSAYALPGAIAQLGIAPFLAMLAALWLLRPVMKRLRGTPRDSFDPQLPRIGGVVLIGGLAVQGAGLVVRALVASELGEAAAGYYHVAFALSGYYLPFLCNGVTAHYYPYACATENRAELAKELDRTVRFLVGAFVPIAMALLLVRAFVISLIWSSEFLPAQSVLCWQVGADLFYLVAFVCDSTLLARGALRVSLVLHLATALSWVALTSWLIPVMGPASITAALTMTLAVKVIVALGVLWRSTGLRVTGALMSYLAAAVTSLVAAALFPVVGPGRKWLLAALAGVALWRLGRDVDWSAVRRGPRIAWGRVRQWFVSGKP